MALSGAAMASRALFNSSGLHRDFKMPIAKVSTVSTSTPGKVRKLNNRKNYLRQKLLKTLTEPYSDSLIEEAQQSPGTLPNESSSEESCSFSLEQYAAGGGQELQELETREFRVAEVAKPAEIIDSNVSGFSNGWILRYGFCLLGAFMFQTIYAVWVLGSADDVIDRNGNTSDERDKSGILDTGLEGKDESKVRLLVKGNKELGDGGVLYLDEADMEKKIQEIQVMAREARERERLVIQENDIESYDSDEDEELDVGANGIEKEVSDRLVKLRRRLGGLQEKLSVSFTGNMKKGDGKIGKLEKDDLDEEGNAALLFKKKYKFRGSLSGKTDKPKGFKNSDLSVPKEVMKDVGNQGLMNGDIVGVGLEKDGERKQSVATSKSSRTGRKKLVEKEGRKPEKGLDLAESKLNGLTQDREEGRCKTVKSSKSSVLETPAISSKHNLLNQKINSKGRGTRNRLSAQLGQKQLESDTDLWWLRLPYVLGIFMHRGLDDEGPRGPFTLRSSSGSNGELSHTVAFEDRRDATNFCYILQSFFDGLGDFSAEIVPLSIKELKAAVDSQIIKVLVVKKGQLKLYAGQPLPDVEMALRSLLGQN